MVEWSFEPRRRVQIERGEVALQTELADPSGARLVVETHRVHPDAGGTRVEADAAFWETTVRRADVGPGEDVLLFAKTPRAREAGLAHEQAVEFTASALNMTLRRGM